MELPHFSFVENGGQESVSVSAVDVGVGARLDPGQESVSVSAVDVGVGARLDPGPGIVPHSASATSGVDELSSWPEINMTEHVTKHLNHGSDSDKKYCNKKKYPLNDPSVLKNYKQFKKISQTFCIHKKCNRFTVKKLEQFESKMQKKLSDLFQTMDNYGLEAEKIFHRVIENNSNSHNVSKLKFKSGFLCQRCNHTFQSMGSFAKHWKMKCFKNCDYAVDNVECKVKCLTHATIHFQQIERDSFAVPDNRLSKKLTHYKDEQNFSSKIFVIQNPLSVSKIINFCRQNFFHTITKTCTCPQSKFCHCSLQHLLNVSCLYNENVPCESQKSERLIAEFMDSIKNSIPPTMFITYYLDTLPKELARNCLRLDKKLQYLFLVNKRLVTPGAREIQSRGLIFVDD